MDNILYTGKLVFIFSPNYDINYNRNIGNNIHIRRH